MDRFSEWLQRFGIWIGESWNTFAHWVWLHWRWFRWSPLAVAAGLVTVTIALPAGDNLVVITVMWLGVAAVSALFADLMRRRTKRLLRIARKDVERGDIQKEDPLYILTESNHFVVLKTEFVHFIFLFLGVSLFIFPEWLRALVGRDAILLGQYLLLLIIARTYLASREVSDYMSRSAIVKDAQATVKEDAEESLRTDAEWRGRRGGVTDARGVIKDDAERTLRHESEYQEHKEGVEGAYGTIKEDAEEALRKSIEKKKSNGD
jgi:hypothetical protein